MYIYLFSHVVPATSYQAEITETKVDISKGGVMLKGGICCGITRCVRIHWSLGFVTFVSGSAGPTGLLCPTVSPMPFGQALDKGDYEFLGCGAH
jgi:hypothetical protein